VRLLGRELERLLHVDFRLRPLLGPLERNAAAEVDRPVPFVDLAQARDRDVVGRNRFGIAFAAALQIRQRERCVYAVELFRDQRREPSS